MSVTELDKKAEKYFRFQKSRIYIYNQNDEHRN